MDVEVVVVLADLPWPFEASVGLCDALYPEDVDFVNPATLEPRGDWVLPFAALAAPLFGGVPACALAAPVVPAFGPWAPTVAVNAIAVAATANGNRFIVSPPGPDRPEISCPVSNLRKSSLLHGLGHTSGRRRTAGRPGMRPVFQSWHRRH